MFDRSFGRLAEDGEDLISSRGSDLADDGEKPVEIAFVEDHVGGTGVCLLTSDFKRNLVGEEDREDGV